MELQRGSPPNPLFIFIPGYRLLDIPDAFQKPQGTVSFLSAGFSSNLNLVLPVLWSIDSQLLGLGIGLSTKSYPQLHNT